MFVTWLRRPSKALTAQALRGARTGRAGCVWEMVGAGRVLGDRGDAEEAQGDWLRCRPHAGRQM